MKKTADRPFAAKFKANIGNYTALIALILVMILFAVWTKGQSMKLSNLKKVLLQALLVIISAAGTIHVSAHGNIDLALGGTIGVSAVAGFLFGGSNNIYLMVFGGMLIGVVFNAIMGYVHAGLNVPALFVGIVGLSIGSKITQLSTSGQSLVMDYGMVGKLDKFAFYLIVTLIVVAIIAVIFNYTKLGKYNKAMGDNLTCAFYSGINIVKYKVTAYALSGAVCGIAAAMRVLRSGSVTYTTGSGVQMSVMQAIIIGGISVLGGNRTRIVYAIIGAMLLQVLSNGLVIVGMDTNLIGLVKGVVFLFAAYLSFDRKQFDVTI